MTPLWGRAKAPTFFCKHLRDTPKRMVLCKILQRDGKPPPPVRMLVNRAWNVWLIHDAKHVLDRDRQNA